MADNIFLKATFKCPQCNHSFNVKHPLKACTATITCPQCKGKFAAKFDDVPDSVLKQLAARQAASAQTAAATKPIPQAQQQQAQEEDSGTKAISFGSISSTLCKLVVVKGFFSSKTRHQLKVGENVIGRADNDVPSDIQLNDAAASRRSANLFVSKGHAGYEYRFSVMKATNPVTVNGKPVMPGESVFLKVGDTIRLGKTKMYLE